MPPKEPGTIEEEIRESTAKREQLGVPEMPTLLLPVCTPTLGVVSALWHGSVMDLIWPMNTAKAAPCFPDRKGGEIAEMRNMIVSAMMATETEKRKVLGIFWLDDDVIVHKKALCALLSHNRPVVSGVYFCKGEFPSPLLFGGPCSGTLPYKPAEMADYMANPASATFEAWGWSQGLSFVNMEVYRRARDELEIGTDKYGRPNWYEAADFSIKDGELRIGGTEDFPFFEKTNKLGYKCLVDCSQFAFGFHYDTMRKIGYPRPQWEQWLRRQPIVWPATADHPEVIWDSNL